MQWLEGLWTKEGAGIDKNAPKLTGLALFFDIFKREWWEMVKLNLLFIIASLPLVTIPAATLAMARVSRSFALDENTYLLRDFVEAFRDYAVRGTLLWAICATLTGACVYATISYAKATQHGILYSAPLAISAVVTLYLCIVTSYAIVLLAARNRPVLATLKEAALFAVVKPLPMLVALAFIAALWLAHILFYPVSVFMPATINFSLGMFALCFAARRVEATGLSQDQLE